MIGICKDCILYKNDCCFAENEPEKITDYVTSCDYYLLNCGKSIYQSAFITGFVYCNKMKKQPLIEKIENRAKQEVFNKLVDIVKNNNFPEYVEDDLINYLKSEGYDV